MYIPVDPDSIDYMWDKLLKSLFSQKNYLIVTAGHFNEKLSDNLLTQDIANEVVVNLKSRDYVRVGTSRLSPIPTHFAIDFADNVGRLMELISLSLDEDNLLKDVSLICQFSFFENKNMKKLIIPFIINGIKDPELRIENDFSKGTTIAYRRS